MILDITDTGIYDSQTGRFINADIFEAVTAIPNALTDKNLYAYCDNNPVMRQDGNLKSLVNQKHFLTNILKKLFLPD